MLSDWYTSGCKPEPRARWVEGQIEIEGEGFPSKPLPDGVRVWSDFINEAGLFIGVPASFIAGVMATESGGDQYAGSHAGAKGLMQLIPSTASHVAKRNVSAEELLNDPKLNIELGTQYLAEQLYRYDNNPIKASAAYNAGGAYCTGNCLNRWGLRADCDKGVAVDYTTRVIEYTNAAVASGLFGGARVSKVYSTWSILGLGAVAVGLAYFWKKRNE